MLLLFGFDEYYPSGGMNDLIGKFNSINEIEEWFKNASYFHSNLDEYHIYDTTTDTKYSYYPETD